MHGSGAIAFPGLGIGEFFVDRVAFTVFGREVYWYGVLIATAFLLGVLLSLRLARENGLDQDHLINLVLITTPVSIVGARVYYVLTTLDRYDSFYDMIAIWKGGIAIYGAILAGMVCFFVYCRAKKLPFLKVLDVAAPSVILGQGIGRWGNFFNQEAFGRVTDLPWRMELTIDGVRQAVHPTFLYESLWDVAGCALLLWIFFHRRADGQTAFSYFVWYGVGRFFIEGLRTDSLYVGPFRISQLVSVALCAVGVVMLRRILRRPAAGAAGEAQPGEAGCVPAPGQAAAELPASGDAGAACAEQATADVPALVEEQGDAPEHAPEEGQRP